jgi:hypothetical protein
MRFLVCRASQGAVSKKPPCKGAVRGEESRAWPGEFEWFVELATLDDLLRFLHETGGAVGVYAPEPGEACHSIEILDEDEAGD